MEKILDIVEAIAHEKGISTEEAIDGFREALINTAKRVTQTPNGNFEVIIDKDKKIYNIYKIISVVSDDVEIAPENIDSFLNLTLAKEYDNSVEIGDKLKSEIVLEDYGRTASSSLFRELEYHIQRRIEKSIFETYKAKVGTVLIGTVNRVDEQNSTFVEIGELRGVLTQRNRIKGEKFKRGDTIKALLRYVSIDPEYGLILELTRTAPKFLEKLMAKEVPEIEDGTVEIMNSSRIPGERAKLSLKTEHMNIDAIGAAVGIKGIRINAVSRELNNENIDCLEYSAIPEVYVTRALSPAIVKSVKIDGDKAIVDITSDQKAKAIGRNGINIRLASMLTGFNIELNEVEGIIDRSAQTNLKEFQENQKTTDTTALEDLFN
ncbi:Transcription termination protein NusA [hydrothermal vent metagenome]|uniref:Transcription termination protein NusA n=1 Tax=hydrothermal vent metagenome TaxID=652676 RepID=A0A1W1EHV4_9ZZZZ